MCRFKLLYIVIFIINLYKTNAQISDKRLCVDEECKVPVSQAKTLIKYSSPDSRILSFAPNVDVTIFSKSAGSREDLWGAEINGKRGYVPKNLVRETRVFQKPTVLVDTEFTNTTENQVPLQVEPGKVQQAYEVVDGTTIYLTPQESINPTSVESQTQPTAVPASSVEQPQDGVAPTLLPPVEQSQDGAASTPVSPVDQPQDGVASVPVLPVEPPQDGVVSPVEPPKDGVVQPASNKEDLKNEEDESDDEGDSNEDEDEKEDLEESEEVADDSNISETQTVEETEVAPPVVQDLVQPEITIPVLETATDSPHVLPEAHEESHTPQQTDDTPIVVKNEENNANTRSEETSSNEDTKSEPASAIVEEQQLPFEINEVTTVSSEIEVPEPIVDGSLEVTQNPVEAMVEAKVVEEMSPTVLPPLSLFGAPSHPPVEQHSAETTVDKQPTEDVKSTVIPESQNQEIVDISPEETLVSPEVAVAAETQDQNVQEVLVNQNEGADEENSVDTEANLDGTVVTENIVNIDKVEYDNVLQEQTTEEEFVHIGETPGEEAQPEIQNDNEEETTLGFLSGLFSFFSANGDDKEAEPPTDHSPEQHNSDELLSSSSTETFCDASPSNSGMDFFSFNSDVCLYLVTTAVSVILFLLGYFALDNSKRQGPLIAKINKLEKQLLVTLKENQILQEKGVSGSIPNDEVVEALKLELLEVSSTKAALEEQIQSLEKELENSTEVGMELNRMLSEILSSESGSEGLKANVEHLQRQLIEQQSTINTINDTLAVTNTENHELRLELELCNKKVLDLQAELDKLLLNVIKIEEEKETVQSSLETELATIRAKYEEVSTDLNLKEESHTIEIKQLKSQLEQTERKLDLKTKERDVLTDTLKQLKMLKNNESTLKNLLEVGEIKAEVQLLKTENQRFREKIQREEELRVSYEKKAQVAADDLQQLKNKYDEADKLRVEAQTKLEVLGNYFNDKEAQWQKEINKHEALWAEKEGEATSTTERIKFMQEQLQNYKSQTESLKQEIMSQEIELKSQISVLEKKAHENWVSARQAERKAEDAKQEAAQLRHRLTLRERAIQEDKSQHRLQSPIEQNGDIPVSPLESPASPPLLYGGRDHITKSPPLPGLPPFLPPPGVPFMPPPLHGVPPFIPPPPNMFPGDHRPPPLGRMSSPPLNSRYSPSSRAYSPYDRNSSSPSDSEYGTSPPHRRGYSPFNNRDRDYKRPPPARSNGRNLIKGGGSSGSGHSNESLEKISRQQSKV